MIDHAHTEGRHPLRSSSESDERRLGRRSSVWEVPTGRGASNIWTCSHVWHIACEMRSPSVLRRQPMVMVVKQLGQAGRAIIWEAPGF